ncbi:response regulator [Roseomonas sp. CCTCC AB2023176]|uniref:response regulator n=1 Tax=Roseomonas sp. CCTCC AB2023176 TaxID=3342640 RepID=UPI0035E30CDC
MPDRVLIVEDEILIALDLSHTLQAMGLDVVAVAADSATARAAAAERPGEVELALVDLNLRDGPSGPALGRELAGSFGITVVHLTANPRQAAVGIEGPVGILPKPYTEQSLKDTVNFALAMRAGRPLPVPNDLRILPRPAEDGATPSQRPRGNAYLHLQPIR